MVVSWAGREGKGRAGMEGKGRAGWEGKGRAGREGKGREGRFLDTIRTPGRETDRDGKGMGTPISKVSVWRIVR